MKTDIIREGIFLSAPLSDSISCAWIMEKQSEARMNSNYSWEMHSVTWSLIIPSDDLKHYWKAKNGDVGSLW